MDSILYNRKLTPDIRERASASGLIDLIRYPYKKRPQSEQEVMKALGFSTPFIELIKHIRSNGDLDSTAIIDMGPEFQNQFKQDARNSKKMHWQQEALSRTPNILKDAGLNTDLEQVLHGWHSVWTHADETYTAIAAITDGRQTTQQSKQQKLLRDYGHNPEGDNTRYDSQDMEPISGFRPGRFSFFLGDDVRENFPSIVLDKSYNQENPNLDEFVFFTVHASFFFICKRSDLSAWLKRPETREAFMTDHADPLRIEGFKFPATERDLETLSTLSGQDLTSLLNTLRQDIPDKVPAEKIPNALAGKIEGQAKKHPQSSLVHLNWRNDEILKIIGS